MSYRRKFYKNNYYDNERRGRQNYYKKRNYNERSRSRDNMYYSKKSNNLFNMYNKNEHLSSSSSESISENNFYVDRTKTCPFLLRIFYKLNSFNSLNLFHPGSFPKELNIYTWEDVDLEEIAKCIHIALKDTEFGVYDYYRFCRIYYDSKGTLLKDEIGAVVNNNKYSNLNVNLNKCLKDLGFKIGDYLDINISSVKKMKKY